MNPYEMSCATAWSSEPPVTQMKNKRQKVYLLLLLLAELSSSMFLLQKVTVAVLGYGSGWIKANLSHQKPHNLLLVPTYLNWKYSFWRKPLKIITLPRWSLNWGQSNQALGRTKPKKLKPEFVLPSANIRWIFSSFPFIQLFWLND